MFGIRFSQRIPVNSTPYSMYRGFVLIIASMLILFLSKIFYQNIFYRDTYILCIAQDIKLTLKAHIYPLAQLLNNTHDLELQHKMKMPRLNSWSHLFASWKK